MARQILLTAALLAAPAARAAEAVRARYVMGTMLTVSVRAEGEVPAGAAAEAALDEVERWDRLLSTYKPDSEVSRLNAAAPGPLAVSTDTLAVLTAALDWSRRTGGAFDATAGSRILAAAGRVELMGGRARLPVGVALDFGGIGKGWALDRALERMDKGGLDEVKMDFGGQWHFWSRDPAARWPAGVRGRPRGFSAPAGSLSTSSQSEKPGHILDPRTGMPAEGVKSVTVWAPDAASADALSTALFVMGLREGAAWAGREGVAALFVEERGRETATPAWRERIR